LDLADVADVFVANPISQSVARVMHFNVFKLHEDALPPLFHLIIGSCSVFYPECPFSSDVNVQFSRQRFGGRPGGSGVFASHFL
jgi:hypothetical protein